jgi:hypothetical protein
MTDVTRGKGIGGSEDTTPAGQPAPCDPANLALFVKLAGALTFKTAQHDQAENDPGYWSDEPLRLADFIA